MNKITKIVLTGGPCAGKTTAMKMMCNLAAPTNGEVLFKGMSAEEIKKRIDTRVPRVKSQFVVRTLDYLHKGGRCSSVAKLFGTILKIRPIIAVREGKMGVAAKPRGKTEAALDCLLDMFREDIDFLYPEEYR